MLIICNIKVELNHCIKFHSLVYKKRLTSPLVYTWVTWHVTQYHMNSVYNYLNAQYTFDDIIGVTRHHNWHKQSPVFKLQSTPFWHPWNLYLALFDTSWHDLHYSPLTIVSHGLKGIMIKLCRPTELESFIHNLISFQNLYDQLWSSLNLKYSVLIRPSYYSHFTFMHTLTNQSGLIWLAVASRLGVNMCQMPNIFTVACTVNLAVLVIPS